MEKIKEEVNLKFSKKIHKLRKEKGLTLTNLSKEIQISITTLSNFEKGKQLPKIRHIIKLAKYFNVKADYLLGLKD